MKRVDILHGTDNLESNLPTAAAVGLPRKRLRRLAVKPLAEGQSVDPLHDDARAIRLDTAEIKDFHNAGVVKHREDVVLLSEQSEIFRTVFILFLQRFDDIPLTVAAGAPQDAV